MAEALRVAEEAIRFMRHHANSAEESLPTIGIAAVNIAQRDLIREELRRLSAGDDLVDEFQSKAEKRGEPVFVKNLENVQGDERDYILISMTYGCEPGAAALKQRFGPINGKQGHRRLNVLFSRARQRIGLFTSFGSADVKPTERSHDGVHVLQRYLAYAEGRGRAPVEKIGADVDSDFEADVSDRLRAKGYEVDYQVGVSGFRIDLGVRHPDKPNLFLAGIECDGAQYHSSKSARDRDRLREEILTGLGWTILRVWSTDWFEDPNEETRKLILKLEGLRAKSQLHASSEDYCFTAESDLENAAENGKSRDSQTIPVPSSERADYSFDQTSDGFQKTIAAATNGNEIGSTLVPTIGKTGALSSKEAFQALRELRESVIAKEIANWEPERSILRDGMIETFLAMKIIDPYEWIRRVPLYHRQNTNPLEKQKYLDVICEIVGRMEEQAV